MNWDWNWFTPLGHVAVVWPLMLAVAAKLIVERRNPESIKGALIWVWTLATASLMVAASKIAFYGWGVAIRSWDLTCLSGHTVLATGFWPVFTALLVSPSRPHRTRCAAALIGAAIATAIAASRAILDFHPWSEVAAGLVPGVLTALVGLHVLRLQQLTVDRVSAIGAVVVSLALWTCTRTSWPTEAVLAKVGTNLSGRERPFSRSDWIQQSVPAETLPRQPQ